ncbi:MULTISPECIES: ERCC4 domain-containing protein [unclassified Thioalkalivibrio]|uniref:ERCC4 domain-containing protein n=1 Tax=unclassified Thioalkalivibrio TaxID=2621013 RepID=UPI000376A376|nr:MULTISPECIES: ERCC4 domain-containing protein [unclassified Thioalkalivibrio]
MDNVHLPIRVDRREQGKIIQRIERLEGVELEFTDLDVGDYLLPNGVVVERKSATDMVLSVVDKTLWENAAKLKANHSQVVYIVEGDLYEPRFHQQALDIHRALAHLTIALGISVLPSPDADNSGMLIYLLGLNAQMEPDPADRPTKPDTRRKAAEFIVSGLPGVEADTARDLLRDLGSVRDIINADAATLAQTDGLDAERAERIESVVTYGSRTT